MSEDIKLKLDELIYSIENDLKVLKLKKLKKEIYEDECLKSDLERFNQIKDLEYSSEYISLKSKIIENPKVSEYRNLENELYFIVLQMNKQLNELVERKGC